MLPPFNEIAADFELLDDWEDRYRYLIELGRMMPPLPEAAHNDRNKVQGCASQVWLEITPTRRDGHEILDLAGDSDAHIVKGLVALLIALMSGRSPPDILATDALREFDKLGLGQHLTPQRSNGLRSMVERLRAEAAHQAASA